LHEASVKIEFSEGSGNLLEAEDLLRVLHYLSMTPSAEILRGEIIGQVFDQFRSQPDGRSRIEHLTDGPTRGIVGRLAALWRGIKGPSHGEIALSKQRHDALDRADRAERSSFEALAEMATVGRERDAMRNDIEVLQLRIKQLEYAISK
jgi:hypothetical protein